MAQWKWTQLVSSRMRVQSLAPLSGLKSGVAMNCSTGRRCSSDPELLRLWCRLAAVAPIRPLAWEFPYGAGVAIKKKKVKKKKKKKKEIFIQEYYIIKNLDKHLVGGAGFEFPILGVPFGPGLGMRWQAAEHWMLSPKHTLVFTDRIDFCRFHLRTSRHTWFRTSLEKYTSERNPVFGNSISLIWL